MSDELNELYDKLPSVTYTVRITHHPSGEVEVSVMDLPDSPTIREDVALDLLQAARAIDPEIDLAAMAANFRH